MDDKVLFIFIVNTMAAYNLSMLGAQSSAAVTIDMD